ncbi:3-deoxy-7-phosphoheptulonate synthase [Lachnoclostridium sp. An181]|uniref:3-deoxy-7-phosphoheptulonate synthase n=1 Tax=Lachnoclostridium sp. An181 TaxID=1965575 RepID=UPI000B3978FC|nr:3-deoxy-7-phosphoheptulonate synthase [Lachnoclostridium sp. An181]OUP51158.1 3-deoxy-7-phosphoheptulonate synthase [Lachnoclostridium sp. An181]
MSMKINHQLFSPETLKEEYPLPDEFKALKKERDEQVKEILSGKSDRFIVLIGPCSADNEDAVCEYMERLAKVDEKVKDKLMIIPRVYTNKPRTTGEGYKGMLHQPIPDEAPDLYAGIIAIRKMHLRVIKECGFTCADEMLYPENRSYLDDLLTYEAIGARSVEDQQHRLTASGMDIPVGMKNPTSGDFTVMLNSIVAAQNGHNFIYRGFDVTTDGNPYAHAILRGGVDKYGTAIPNYHYEDLMRLLEMYGEWNLKNPAAIVDANHSNSNKKYKEQLRIVSEVLHSRNCNPDIKKLVKGVMVESYLVEGNQKINEERIYGKSITDPCIGWEDTEKLLYKIAEMS